MHYNNFEEVMDAFVSITYTGTLMDLIVWYNTLHPEYKEELEHHNVALYQILETLTNTFNEEQGKDDE